MTCCIPHRTATRFGPQQLNRRWRNYWARRSNWIARRAEQAMPAGPIRFGRWLFRLFAWDSLLPVIVALIPGVIEWLFPNRQGFIEAIAVVLPIVAFFVRLRAGRRHIFKNNCTRAFRSFQFVAFFLGIFLLALLDCVIVLSYIMP